MPSYTSGSSLPPSANDAEYPTPSAILRQAATCLHRQRRPILVLTLTGLILGCLGGWWATRDTRSSTSVNIAFSFPGFERGEYPDGSQFQPTDLYSDAILAEVLRRNKVEPTAERIQKIHSAISVVGTMPLSIVHERDRVRSTGQRPASFIPDEYTLSIYEPRGDAGLPNDPSALLDQIIGVYRETFFRTHTQLPAAFGQVMESLSDADYIEYDLILNTQIQNIATYLREHAAKAGSFRSPHTGLSFHDLLEQTQLFSQIRLNETLGIIYQFGLSRDRALAMSKMAYQLKLLDLREKGALKEEQLVNELLGLAQSRGENVVLGARSPSAKDVPGEAVDQGLINSIMANDSYSFLVRAALEAGLRTKQIQSERGRWLALRDNIQSFNQSTTRDQTAAFAQAQQSLGELRSSFERLISAVKQTYADYAAITLGESVRVSRSPWTTRSMKKILLASVAGAIMGMALAVGIPLARSPVTYTPGQNDAAA